MFNSKPNKLTDYAAVFLQPQNATHRQYEALRAHFVEGLSSKDVAERFGYTPGSFRVLAHGLRTNPGRSFFPPPTKGPQKAPRKDKVRKQVIALRKQNLSIYDISRALAREEELISPVSVSLILREEGFARLPRRGDEERPEHARPTVADVADVRQLDLSERQFRTKFGGLFIFLPYVVEMGFDRMISRCNLPGSKMIPAAHAMRSLLALKLFGSARHSHVMSDVLDEGLALFAGLNAIPKRSYLTEYSCRIDPECYPVLMRGWFDAIRPLGLCHGESFDLDFHTIPFHGEDALVQKHYVSKRSRRQKGLLAFVAQDASTRVFCYANANIRKEDQADEVLQFVGYWKERTGTVPQELIFDSKLTTYMNLSKLTEMGIRFITLRRRSRNMVQAAAAEPLSSWQRIELDGVARIYRTPRILDRTMELKGYSGLLREMVIADLGHEEPTFLITNQLKASAPKLIKRYAQRMLIENGIEDASTSFIWMPCLQRSL
jgi:transposase